MADGAVDTLTAPVGWAKAKPLAFIIFLFVVVLLVLRFRHAIARWIVKIPKLGAWLVGGKKTVVQASMTDVGGVSVAAASGDDS
jgi:hypothetical protein